MRVGALVVLFSLGCGNGRSPVQPTPPLPAPTPLTLQEFSLSGTVVDTAWRPLGGSRVEVVAGARAGTVTTTNEGGRFWLPGTFTGTIAVRASKEGYIPETTTVPPQLPAGRPLPPLSPGEERRWDMPFSLQLDGPSANIAGVYTLTLTAGSGCTNLPEETRTRTYSATIVPGHRAGRFIGSLSDAGIVFSTYSPYFEIGVAGDFASMSVRLVERLGETTFLAIDGGAAASVGPSGITAPFNAYFLHCPTQPAWSAGEYWWCGADVQGVECNSSNHQLTLVPR